MNILKKLEKELAQMELETLLNGKYDKHSCMLSIQCGLGGADAQDWTSMLARMYQRYAERKGFQVTILDLAQGEHGLKSIDMRVEGSLAYGYLAREKGTHRLVRISPFNALNKRQTSFAGVETWPLLEDEEVTAIELVEKVKPFLFYNKTLF